MATQSQVSRLRRSRDPAVVAQNHKMASLTQAFAIDLTGQVCADQFQGEFYSGVSTQLDFHRGAARSPEGKPIVCLRSTTDDGTQSRIRPRLLEGEGVTLARPDVHYVVTEYGIAYLFGKSVRERAMALIEIAHPDFRESLLDEAKRQSLAPAAHRLASRRGYLGLIYDDRGNIMSPTYSIRRGNRYRYYTPFTS